MHGVRRVFVCGLATDYCVKATALDAHAAGFTTFVIADASAAVDVAPGDEARRSTNSRGGHRRRAERGDHRQRACTALTSRSSSRTGSTRSRTSERHGSPRDLFGLWFGANAETANFAVGIIAVSLYGTSLAGAIVGLADRQRARLHRRLARLAGRSALRLAANDDFAARVRARRQRAAGDLGVSRRRRLVLDRLRLRRAGRRRAVARELSVRARADAGRRDRSSRCTATTRSTCSSASRRWRCCAGYSPRSRSSCCGTRTSMRRSIRTRRWRRAVSIGGIAFAAGARVRVRDRLGAMRRRLRALPARGDVAARDRLVGIRRRISGLVEPRDSRRRGRDRRARAGHRGRHAGRNRRPAGRHQRALAVAGLLTVLVGTMNGNVMNLYSGALSLWRLEAVRLAAPALAGRGRGRARRRGAGPRGRRPGGDGARLRQFPRPAQHLGRAVGGDHDRLARRTRRLGALRLGRAARLDAWASRPGCRFGSSPGAISSALRWPTRSRPAPWRCGRGSRRRSRASRS